MYKPRCQICSIFIFHRFMVVLQKLKILPNVKKKKVRCNTAVATLLIDNKELTAKQQNGRNNKNVCKKTKEARSQITVRR